ncbi:MAG TPA: hypothetical protein VFX13_11120 [Gaiellales bacterium]|nr:hypothetical protein [Gaiellales bacterium]
MKGLTAQNVRGIAAAGHFGDITTHNSSVLKNAAGKFDKLATSQQHAADVATQHNNPALARSQQNAARASRAVADLIRELGRMPTRKEIQVDIITNRYTGATTGPPTGGTSGDPHRATGGPVAAFNRYLVGERGPELFIPDRNGTIIPNGAAPAPGGGYWSIRIENPETLEGRMRWIARGEVGANTRRRGQLQRMGA